MQRATEALAGLGKGPKAHRLGWGLLLTGGILHLAPQMHGWPLLHVHKEDGKVYLSQQVGQGYEAGTVTYSGFIHLIPRVIAGIAAQAPPVWYPVVVALLVMALKLLMSTMAWMSLREWFAPGASFLAGALFLFVPVGFQEGFANITNIRWFAVASLIVVSLGAFRKWWQTSIAVALVLSCALSDPLAVGTSPLFIWQMIRGKARNRVVGASALIAIGVHMLMVEPSARPLSLAMWSEPLMGLQQVLVRGPLVAQFGQNGAELLLGVLGPWALATLLPALWLCARFVTAQTALPATVLGFGGFSALIATLLFADMPNLPIDPPWGVGQGSRYSIVPAILIGSIMVLAAVSRLLEPRSAQDFVLAIFVASALLVGTLGDAVGDRANVAGPRWSDSIDQARARCADGGKTVSIPITPSGFATDWHAEVTCSWVQRGR